MYILGNKTASLIERTTFSQLGKYESDIEEILRKNMDMVCDSDAESYARRFGVRFYYG